MYKLSLRLLEFYSYFLKKNSTLMFLFTKLTSRYVIKPQAAHIEATSCSVYLKMQFDVDLK